VRSNVDLVIMTMLATALGDARKQTPPPAS